MYKIRNIWADPQYEGNVSNPFDHQRIWTNLEIEPYVNGYPLMLNHELNLTDEYYELHKNYFAPYIQAKILKITKIHEEKPKDERGESLIFKEEKIEPKEEIIEIKEEIKEDIDEEKDDKKKKKLKK